MRKKKIHINFLGIVLLLCRIMPACRWQAGYCNASSPFWYKNYLTCLKLNSHTQIIYLNYRWQNLLHRLSKWPIPWVITLWFSSTRNIVTTPPVVLSAFLSIMEEIKLLLYYVCDYVGRYSVPIKIIWANEPPSLTGHVWIIGCVMSCFATGRDYINASYIDGYTNKKNKYIATMSPFNEDCVIQFWQMVYEQNVSKIIMVRYVWVVQVCHRRVNIRLVFFSHFVAKFLWARVDFSC